MLGLRLPGSISLAGAWYNLASVSTFHSYSFSILSKLSDVQVRQTSSQSESHPRRSDNRR